MSRINKEDTTRFHENGLYLPTKTIRIGDGDDGEIDSVIAAQVIKNLHVCDQTRRDDPINIKLLSNGGLSFLQLL